MAQLRPLLACGALLTLLLSPLSADAQLLAPVGLPAGTILYQTEPLDASPYPIAFVSASYRVTAGGTAAPVDPVAVESFARAYPIARGGDQLRLTGGRDTRSGWVLVSVADSVPVMLDGIEIASAAIQLRMLPGTYTVGFSGGESERIRVQAETQTVVRGPEVSPLAEGAPPGGNGPQPETREAPEVAVGSEPEPTAPEAVLAREPPAGEPGGAPEPSETRSASFPGGPLLNEAARRRIEGSPFAQGLGGETVPDTPLAGWVLTSIPSSAAEPPAQPSPMPTRREPRPPIRSRPLAVDQPGVLGEPAVCPASAEEDFQALANELVLKADYAAARTCLIRHSAIHTEDYDALSLSSALERVIVAERAMAPETRDYLVALRGKVRQAAAAGDLAQLTADADQLLGIFPGDPATVNHLRAAYARSVSPGEGPPVALVYVPGASARLPNDLSLRSITNPPEAGFLLSATEITNEQFAHFLNGIPKHQRSEYDFLVPRRTHLVRTRQEEWQPLEGSADLPVVEATWYGAQAYARWMGGHLPSATEWEWAYRMGGDDGSGANLGSGDRRLRPVHESKPDGLGLHDMLGNVWEWLATDGRVVRTQNSDHPRQVAGGGFTSPAASVHARLIDTIDALTPNGMIGFRVLLPVTAPSSR